MLEFEWREILSPTKNGPRRQFTVVVFPVTSHKNDVYRQQAIQLAMQQGGTNRSPSGTPRSQTTLLKTRYLGALSELMLRDLLSHELGVNIAVMHQPYASYSEHVDLRIVYQNGKVLTIEVRGSFPFSRIDRVIFELFDVIGVYTTDFKRTEAWKDWHLRTLINCKVDQFDYQLDHELLFVGGADRSLFQSIGVETDFKQQGASYRTIKPIAAAYDAREVIDLIRQRLVA